MKKNISLLRNLSAAALMMAAIPSSRCSDLVERFLYRT